MLIIKQGILEPMLKLLIILFNYLVFVSLLAQKGLKIIHIKSVLFLNRIKFRGLVTQLLLQKLYSLHELQILFFGLMKLFWTQILQTLLGVNFLEVFILLYFLGQLKFNIFVCLSKLLILLDQTLNMFLLLVRGLITLQ